MKEVELLIMDDDLFFNNLLAKKFSNFKDLPEIKGKYSVSIQQFSTPDDCMAEAIARKTGKHIIAFVDYFIGKNVNGQQLTKLLIEQNSGIKVILMSESARVIGELTDYSRVIKREFTPEICCMMLMQFLINH